MSLNRNLAYCTEGVCVRARAISRRIALTAMKFGTKVVVIRLEKIQICKQSVVKKINILPFLIAIKNINFELKEYFQIVQI